MGIDLVHVFGIVRPQEAWMQARNATRQNKPLVVSPVYCDVSDFERSARAGPVGWLARHTSTDTFEALKAVGRGIHSREWSKGSAMLVTRGFAAMQHDIVNMAALFLPNSASEWSRLECDLDMTVDVKRVVVVPNGVDLGDFDVSMLKPADLTRLAEFRGAVLCVARIDGRKNQLNLIEALDGSEFTLVLAGAATPNQTRYVAKVRSAVARSPNTFYLGEVSADARRALYALARVHVLPSWMETTGLSSLEAAVMDCSVVVSPQGDTREYFGEDVEYCDPASPVSIRDAVRRAASREPSISLAAHIRRDLTWDKAAAATYEAYQQLEPTRS
jgi:glycosyltransferase involved in cell wall biosynthesis